MDDIIKQCLSHYKNSDHTKRDILKVRKTFQSLFCIKDTFTFSNGVKRDLVKLKGTIPVPFKGRTYNIPICIWIMDTHPQHAPICLVEPTPEMCLKQSIHLDSFGKVYLPYLHSWSATSSNLVDLIQVMIKTFSESPPVYAKRKVEAVSHSTVPYPVQNFTTVQSSSSPGVTLYPVSGISPAYPPYPSSQNNPPNFQYTPYPTYTNQNNNFQYPYPSGFSPSTVSGLPPVYPSQPLTRDSTVYPPPTSIVTSTTSSVSNTGTITDEHIRASLMSAIEDKIRRKINEQTALCHDEIEILLQTQRELNAGKNKLDIMFDNLEKEKQNITQKIEILKNKEEELEKMIEKLSVEEDVDVDDAVVTTTPLYKQILNTHCEDAATEDTIYYIGEALRRGVIDLDVFIRQLRALSRKRLMLRSLLEKCRMKAGLTV